MNGDSTHAVDFVDPTALDRAAWDAHVIDTSGNPTQLAAFGELGGALRKPVYAQVRRGSDVVMRWLFYYAGLPYGLGYLDIRSEPTSQEPALVGAALHAAIRRFKPFRITLGHIVESRWCSREALAVLGFETLRPYGTIVLDLRIGREALWSGVHKRHRNHINRGRRDGLVLEEQSDEAGVARLYPLVRATRRRGGAETIPRFEHVRAHARALCPTGNGRLFFAVRGGVDYGAIFDFVTPNLALGWLGGTRADAPATAGKFLQWAVIERLCEEGVAAYDLGGVDTQAEESSKGANILAHKHRYGGVLTHHCMGVNNCGRLRMGLHNRLLWLRDWVH